MKVKTIELFEFDELPEKIKAKVLEKNRYINTEGEEWCQFELEDWKTKLESMGFENPEISYSGFYCQGDGASFVCKSVDAEKFLRSQKKLGEFKALLNAVKNGKADFSAEIFRIDHHYSHYNTISAQTEVQYYEDNNDLYITLEKLEGQFRNLVLSVAKDLSKKLYSDLEKTYEGMTSDEAVIDTIKANEYTFRSNGEMENL